MSEDGHEQIEDDPGVENEGKDVDVVVVENPVERSGGGEEVINNAIISPTYRDHFLLHRPTSDVRYRGSSVHVYELRSSQIQLATIAAEATENGMIVRPEGYIGSEHGPMEHLSLTLEMKEVPSDRASALGLLRATYTLVALFFAGIVSSDTEEYDLICTNRRIYVFRTARSSSLPSCSYSAFW